ncbi:DUF7577 domain-containing protein [Natronobacterium gregoryi]
MRGVVSRCTGVSVPLSVTLTLPSSSPSDSNRSRVLAKVSQADMHRAIGGWTMGTTDSSRAIQCRHCRTENDVFYTYCRNCLETLPSRRS